MQRKNLTNFSIHFLFLLLESPCSLSHSISGEEEIELGREIPLVPQDEDTIDRLLRSPTPTSPNASTSTSANESVQYSLPSSVYYPSIKELKKREKNKQRSRRKKEQLTLKHWLEIEQRRTLFISSLRAKSVELQKEAQKFVSERGDLETAKERASEARRILAALRFINSGSFEFENPQNFLARILAGRFVDL